MFNILGFEWDQQRLTKLRLSMLMGYKIQFINCIYFLIIVNFIQMYHVPNNLCFFSLFKLKY